MIQIKEKFSYDFPDFRKSIKAGVLMVNIGMETEQIEYKKTTGELKEAITSIVAILNKHGSLAISLFVAPVITPLMSRKRLPV